MAAILNHLCADTTSAGTDPAQVRADVFYLLK
jgi:hypothetical protein